MTAPNDTVYLVMGHEERNTWIENLYFDKDKALAKAKELAGIFFEDRNHQDDSDLKLFTPDNWESEVAKDPYEGDVTEELLDEEDTTAAFYSYGYSWKHAEPLITVIKKKSDD